MGIIINPYLFAPSFESTLCGEFDGVNDYVNCGNDASLLATTFSISVWVNPAALTNWTVICARDMNYNGSYSPTGQGWQLRIDGSGYVHFEIAGGSSTCKFLASDMTAGSWNHLAITYDLSATEGKIYLDGVLKATDSIMTLVFTNMGDPNFLIGARNQDTGVLPGKDNWNGAIDEVGYWNSVLNATMVGEAYGGGSPADYDNLSTAPVPVSWWRMGENAPAYATSDPQWLLIENSNAV